MNNNFTPYEESIELKELGFDEKCLTSYNPKKELVGVFDTALQNDDVEVEDCFVFNSEVHTTFVAAPLYQQAFKFFREKYNLICSVQYMGKNKINWWDIYIVGHYNIHYEEMCMKYESYEEAELAGLKKLIEIAKTK